MTACTIHQLPDNDRARLTLLAVRFCDGDRDALAELYAEIRGQVFAVALRILGRPEDAEDVTQWAFLRAWEARESLRKPATIKAWIIRIAANRANNLWGRRNRFDDSDCLDRMADDNEGVDDCLAQAQHRKMLSQGIETLSPRQHDVICLRIREELSFKEIGSRLGCTDVSARVNFLHGVRNLRERIAA